MIRYLLPFILLAPAAQAEGSCLLFCGERESVHQSLRVYGEEITARGVTGGGALLTIYTDREGGTWTVVMTLPSGESCVLSAGSAWEKVIPGQPL